MIDSIAHRKGRKFVWKGELRHDDESSVILTTHLDGDRMLQTDRNYLMFLDDNVVAITYSEDTLRMSSMCLSGQSNPLLPS